MSNEKNKREQTRQGKSAADARCEMVLQSITDGFGVVSPDGKLVEVNQALCDITGYSKDELLEMKVADLDAKQSPEETSKHVEKIIKKGSDRFETKHRRKDGKIINVEVSAQCFDQGDNKFFFFFVRDVTRRKQAEKMLGESEEKYRKLIETAGDAIFVADCETGILLDANKKAEELTGMNADEIIGMHQSRLHPKEETEKYERIFKDHVEKEKGVISEDIFVCHKDGRKIPVEISAGVAEVGGRKIMHGIFRDITARRQAEKMLEENEEKYRKLIETAGDAIFVADCETGILLEANKKAEELLGMDADEIIGMHQSRLHPKEEAEKYEHIFADHVQKGKGFSHENVFVCHRDGHKIPVEISAGVTQLGGRKVIHGSFRDITARKEAEEALQRRDSILTAISVCSEQLLKERSSEKKSLSRVLEVLGRAASVSRAYIFKNHLGEDGGELTSQLCEWVDEGIAPQIDNPELQNFRWRGLGMMRWPEVLSKGGFISGHVKDFPAGERAVLEPQDIKSILAVPIFTKQKWWGFVGFDECLRERTWSTVEIDALRMSSAVIGAFIERKVIETKLDEYKEKVLRAQRHAYIGSIGAIAAHQINGPLTMINMQLGRALEQAEDASQQASVKNSIAESLAEVKRATAIIHKFREYSRDTALSASGKINVSKTANKIISVLPEIARDANIRVSAKSLDELPEVEINETALEQIFLIIIQNAIEAADDKKTHRLEISGKRNHDGIELLFADNCCGIAAENIEKVFELFFSTKPESRGMGLGLNIVRHILLGCGGEIRVESELGKGSNFYLTLPTSTAR